LRAMAGAAPLTAFAETVPFLHAMLVEAGCDRKSVGACHLPGTLPGQARDGGLAREPFAAASNFLTAPLSPAGVAAALAPVLRQRLLRVQPATAVGRQGAVRPREPLPLRTEPAPHARLRKGSIEPVVAGAGGVLISRRPPPGGS